MAPAGSDLDPPGASFEAQLRRSRQGLLRFADGGEAEVHRHADGCARQLRDLARQRPNQVRDRSGTAWGDGAVVGRGLESHGFLQVVEENVGGPESWQLGNIGNVFLFASPLSLS